jgi:predicted regulator of Ras-like GTPase activity (Roadblock/LC7/MglB family)
MSVAMVHKGANQMGTEIKINRLKTLTFESRDATIMCSPIGDALLTVVAPNSKTLGIIRQKVKKLTPVFRN